MAELFVAVQSSLSLKFFTENQKNLDLNKKICQKRLIISHDETKMNKERPCELNQKIKRLKTSRDELKLNNRDKAQRNKKLRDRNVEVTENRDQWKARSKELNRQKEDLERQIQAAKEEAERERMRADEERKRADGLQAEIEAIWKKKSRT